MLSLGGSRNSWLLNLQGMSPTLNSCLDTPGANSVQQRENKRSEQQHSLLA